MDDLKLLKERRVVILRNMGYALKYGKNDMFLSFKKQLDDIDSSIEKLKKVQESITYPYFF
jgi:hypothetical protein